MENDNHRSEALHDFEPTGQVTERIGEGQKSGLLHRHVIEKTKRILKILQRLQNAAEAVLRKDGTEKFHQIT